MALRVALITPGGLEQRGGIGAVARELVEDGASRHDISWHVLDPWGSGSVLLQPLVFLVTAARLLALGLARSVDLVHLNLAGGGSLVRKGILILLARALGLKTVVHLHASRLDCTYAGLPAPLRRCVRLVLRSADAVVVLGTHWRRFALDVLCLDPARVHVVPNGLADPGPTMRPEREETRILFVGCLGERKGTPTLLEALSRPELSDANWCLTLAGDGRVEEMRALARQLGVDLRSAFLGWLSTPDIHRLMRSADVLVLPSRHEGLPMAVLEAMAHGLPVVTTRAGALADAVLDEETGLIVPADAPRALASALARLVDDPALRRRLGEAARRRFLQSFTLEGMTDRIVALYGAVLADGPIRHRVPRRAPEVVALPDGAAGKKVA